MSIIVTLSHDKNTLEALRDEWIDLQARSSATSVTMMWQGIHIYLKYFGNYGELWLLTAREDDRLIGIVPLMKVKVQPSWGFSWQQLEFIGASDNHTDLDFIIETGYEKQVIPLFMKKLNEHKTRWDVISLTAFSDTQTPDILQQSDDTWTEFPQKNLTVPYMTLPNTIDEWMQSISRNHRWKLRRYRKKLDEQFPNRWSITQVFQPNELDYTFEHLVRLNQERWEAVGETGTFYNEERTAYFYELVHNLLEAGWLRMYRLDIDDNPCAIYFCSHYLGRAYFLLVSVDRNITDLPLGYVVLEHSINQAITEDCREFSFGDGKQAYKYSFGGINRVHRAFRLIGSPRVRLQLQTLDFLRGTKTRLRNIATDTPAEKANVD